ncbi:MAG: hypothetical protein VYA84_15675 [Planctomycetota bacterium]|nr:hypothetical protein [Planctomycetota bacterium]
MIRFLLGVLVASAASWSCFANASETVNLRYRSYRTWSIHLPAEKWFPVNEGIKISHAGGDQFDVELEGNSLRFDTDGDGMLDRTIKPLVDPKTNVSTTRVVLTGKTEAGEPLRYAARLRKDANGWEWAPGGAMAGIITAEAGPVPIRIIDQNGNGRFDDFGKDAMVVGSSDHAMLLSKTVQVDDTLQNIEFVGDGKSIKLSTFTGETAEIDMSTSFHSKGVLLSSVIVSEDGQHSFDVGAIQGPVEVPAGTYSIVGGVLGLGNHRVQIASGRMSPLNLAAGSSTDFDWGGPIVSEFQFARRGNQVQFSPDHIWYYGRAGEQYAGWNPIGKSPEFKILDADTGVVLEVAILPGSC